MDGIGFLFVHRAIGAWGKARPGSCTLRAQVRDGFDCSVRGVWMFWVIRHSDQFRERWQGHRPQCLEAHDGTVGIIGTCCGAEQNWIEPWVPADFVGQFKGQGIDSVFRLYPAQEVREGFGSDLLDGFPGNATVVGCLDILRGNVNESTPHEVLRVFAFGINDEPFLEGVSPTGGTGVRVEQVDREREGDGHCQNGYQQQFPVPSHRPSLSWRGANSRAN